MDQPGTRTHGELEEIFGEVEAPFAFVDLDAMWANGESMLQRAGEKPIRVATKSLRCRPLIEQILDRDDRFQGLMTFTLPETLWLAERGMENLLLAYPTTDLEALGELALRSVALQGASPVVMVDCVEHLDLIESILGTQASPVRLCLELDAALWAYGGRVKAGTLRSPIHSPEDAVALAEEIGRREKLELVGLMAYEAQIAGLGDRIPGRPFRSRAIRSMQKKSRAEIAERRAETVAKVREVAPLEFVNGGGTGSLESTSAEEAVTEVAAGSGFFAPAQFDHYSNLSLRPAAGYALPVVRRPEPRVVTALGGGYLASGPPDPGRMPVPWLPEGLEFEKDEGAGEVQTPLVGEAAQELAIGDNVYLRHAKAGELCERFESLILIEGDEIVDEVPTYRGEGQTFL
ncbi:MAG TPA: amino acid deaminase/aldolase [Solirubrobacterales bacterium]|nr:amino acid deaminase/aldolase [Solirubrobacterales bacterium]HMU26008.1 amino acid deaminase/aldolase [Solirubrobacterales bacterium]HMX70808.1 amino acid deaminase/aldolase [Solirubrobacterales bacterium]HMY26209.1 amino acid deaminase/aldolase [Solirubrobacterales bacterium]HNA24380.1 amino acid deaminase/aldolase [Solirubrobacterales bacterium]